MIESVQVTQENVLSATQFFDGLGFPLHVTDINLLVASLADHLARHRIASAAQVEQRAIEKMVAKFRQDTADEEGRWRTCSGCYECKDGYPNGFYPHSNELGCTLGGGCSDCGGLGAIWDTTDYAQMARDMLDDDLALSYSPSAPTDETKTIPAQEISEELRQQNSEYAIIRAGKLDGYVMTYHDTGIDALNSMSRLTGITPTDEVARLRSALERLQRNFDLLLQGKPVRDVLETDAEVRSALASIVEKPE